MQRQLTAALVSLGIAFGSLGVSGPVSAATYGSMSAGPSVKVHIVKHKPSHRRLVCRTVWVKKKIWRHHHRVWIVVPVKKCHWVWRRHY
jgi:hypothetical protein